jgi:hypothetical protein
MDQLVLLLIIGAISLINWLLQKSAEHREKKKAESLRRDGPPQPIYQDRETSGPNEQARKFLEALGLPDDALPPTPVAPPPLPPGRQADIGHSEQAPPKPPVRRNFLHKVQPDLERRLFASEVVEPVFEPIPKARRSIPVAPPVATADAPAGGSKIRSQLATPEALRRAIIVREILGPPRALQDL